MRVGFPTASELSTKKQVVESVRELLLGAWKLPAPKLIISVTGSAEELRASKMQQNRFKNGVIRTSIGLGTGALVALDNQIARATHCANGYAGVWITTGGMKCGVMKLVGKAVRDYCTAAADPRAPPIV